jgi:hypothetical protein
VGLLLFKKLVSLELVSADGMRVRASAGAASFRSEQGLAACEEQARLHLQVVLEQAEDEELTPGQKARRRSAAEDYLQRVQEAKAHLASLTPPEPPPSASGEPKRRPGPKPQKPAPPPRKPRVSTTDPEARVMKMADGGYRPAFNIQLLTAGSALGGPRTVVGLLVSNQGSDMGSLVPLVESLVESTGQKPKVLLADSNHAKYDDIEQLRGEGIRVLVPEPESRFQKGTHVRHSPELDAWRADMQSEEGKTLYRARAGLSECANAHLKSQQGVTQFVVRGAGKVVCAVLLGVLSTTLLQHASGLLN